jgi:hypothetical protein
MQSMFTRAHKGAFVALITLPLLLTGCSVSIDSKPSDQVDAVNEAVGSLPPIPDSMSSKADELQALAIQHAIAAAKDCETYTTAVDIVQTTRDAKDQVFQKTVSLYKGESPERDLLVTAHDADMAYFNGVMDYTRANMKRMGCS